jgi:hypothetical protein
MPVTARPGASNPSCRGRPSPGSVVVKGVPFHLLRVKKELLRLGLLPFTDQDVPSLVSIVARGRVTGSWWGHPAGQLIYQVGEALGSDPGVLTVRLWRGKLTLVHRRLWPALARIGTARSGWQMAGLSDVATLLLAHVDHEGRARSDRLPADFPSGSLGFRPALRSLDQRLLLLTRSVHTSTGAHALEAESWVAWKARSRTPTFSGSAASAEHAIEAAVRRLAPGVDPLRTLPWGRSRPKLRSSR